jgi:hypothetical protein
MILGLGVASLPHAAAIDPDQQSSTLAPQLAPRDLDLDAAISSMVKRRLIADVRTAQADPAPAKPAADERRAGSASTPSTAWRAKSPANAGAAPRPAAQRPKSSSSGWRAAAPSGTIVAPAEPIVAAPQAAGPPAGESEAASEATAPAADEPVAEPSFPEFPSFPTTPTARPEAGSEPIGTPADEVDGGPVFLDVTPEDESSAAPPSDDDEDGESAPADDLALAVPGEPIDADDAPPIDAEEGDEPTDEETEFDAGEPIDELSETPAPASDAPGDPIEPEYTGPSLSGPAPRVGDAAGQAAARPLPGARKLNSSNDLPAGEPDRFAEADESIEPADPESYEEADAPSGDSKKLRPLSRNQRALRDKIRRVLQFYYNRPLNTADRSPWEVMHAMLAYEVHSQVLQGGPQGEPITAVGWLCFNQPCKNRSLMYLNEGGDLRVKVGPALQGHQGQLLALLAQARVRSDYPLRVDGQEFTIVDLIEMEKLTCYPRTELTFKLIGLQRYLDINDTWVNDQGMQWDFPTLLREEMRQPVRTAACGGTHRLSGLALTVKKRRASGLPVDGEYAKAFQFVANYQNYAYRLQNPDGSFSTDWFKGPGAEPDIDRRLKTTGHTLEWMIYSSSDDQLTNPRMVRAVNYLTNIMYANRTRDWEAGPLGHAIHALVLYDRLVFAKYDEAAPTQPKAPAAPVARRQGRARR